MKLYSLWSNTKSLFWSSKWFLRNISPLFLVAGGLNDLFVSTRRPGINYEYPLWSGHSTRHPAVAVTSLSHPTYSSIQFRITLTRYHLNMHQKYNLKKSSTRVIYGPRSIINRSPVAVYIRKPFPGADLSRPVLQIDPCDLNYSICVDFFLCEKKLQAS